MKLILTYAGAMVEGDALVHVYFDMLDTSTLAEQPARKFPKALLKCLPGSVLTIESGKEGFFPGSARFIRQFPDKNQVNAWRIAHDAEIDSYRADKGQRLDLPFDELEPFRTAFRSLDESSRAVLIAQVVRHISKGVA